VKSHHYQHSQSGETLSEEALPPVTRRAQIDLEAEGIDPEALLAPASASQDTVGEPLESLEDNAGLDVPDGVVTPGEEDEGRPCQESLAARVADLEATVDELVANQSPDGETVSVPVRVVDAGEDLTLLRVDGDEFPDLPHGTTLQVTVDEDTIEGPESTDSK
jgi:hypothetical protein